MLTGRDRPLSLTHSMTSHHRDTAAAHCFIVRDVWFFMVWPSTYSATRHSLKRYCGIRTLPLSTIASTTSAVYHITTIEKRLPLVPAVCVLSVASVCHRGKHLCYFIVIFLLNVRLATKSITTATTWRCCHVDKNRHSPPYTMQAQAHHQMPGATVILKLEDNAAVASAGKFHDSDNLV